MITPPHPSPVRPRPWLTRREGECAWPVAGDGAAVVACCAPSGRGPYCPRHARRRTLRAPAAEAFAAEVLAWLEARA